MSRTLVLPASLPNFTLKQSLSLILPTLIILVPALFRQQFFTGPLINALLILALIYLGRSSALFLALLPSTVALSVGLLPVALAPMLPFIMISNALYLLIFANLRGQRQSKNFLAIVVAALLKAAFLFFISKLLMDNLLSAPLAQQVAKMMSWPQLWTAVLGGVMALLINQALEKKYGRV